MNPEHITQLMIEKGGEAGPAFALNPMSASPAEATPALKTYLEHCLPKRSMFVSAIYLLPAEEIDAATENPDAFGWHLRQAGYLVIGHSMGGDLLVVEWSRGEVWWFDKTAYLDGIGTLIGIDGQEVAPTRENLQSVGVFLGQFHEGFLLDLYAGRFSALLRRLD